MMSGKLPGLLDPGLTTFNSNDRLTKENSTLLVLASLNHSKPAARSVNALPRGLEKFGPRPGEFNINEFVLGSANIATPR